MKTHVSLAILALLLMAGCATTDTNIRRWERTAEVVAYVGTVKALESNPEWRPGFEEAARDLALLEQDEIDTIAVLEIIRRLPVKELRSDDAALYIEDGIIVLSDHFGAIPLDKLESQRPVIAAVRRGIERGLNYSSAP